MVSMCVRVCVWGEGMTEKWSHLNSCSDPLLAQKNLPNDAIVLQTGTTKFCITTVEHDILHVATSFVSQSYHTIYSLYTLILHNKA